MKLSSKQRAYLKSLAVTEDTIIHIGKEGLSPELIQACDEALSARELIKVGVLKNCTEDAKEAAVTISERTRSTLVHVIGKKIVLYRPDKDKPRIKLPL